MENPYSMMTICFQCLLASGEQTVTILRHLELVEEHGATTLKRWRRATSRGISL